MLARRREEVIPRPRPGIPIIEVMIMAFFTAQQFIALDALLKGQKFNQEYFVQKIPPSLLNEKKSFSRQKTAINFSVQMDDSICHNGIGVVDELHPLMILKALHPPCSPNISPCDFWIFGDFKGKLTDRHLQGPKEIFTRL
jgi:hypothetical protein